MNKIKIVITRRLLPVDYEYIVQGLKKIVNNSFELISPKTYNEDEICKIVSDADVLLGSYITKRILSEAKKLKLIQIPWTGMDTFDFNAVSGFSVPVCNTHSSADAVAEFGVSLVLDLLKKVSYHDRKMRIGDWNRDQKPLDLNSGMVSKQVICILGYGNIGQRISKLLYNFGADIVVVDEFVKDDNVIRRGYQSNQIKEAINMADVIISTLPLTESTYKLINDDLVSVAKTGALLVNMSRAEVMDEDAVYRGLLNGHLGGFASDVWWNAPKRGESQSFPSDHNVFWTMDNVVMSPHRAGFIEGSLPHLDEAIINLANLIQNKPLINIVDVKKHF